VGLLSNLRKIWMHSANYVSLLQIHAINQLQLISGINCQSPHLIRKAFYPDLLNKLNGSSVKNMLIHLSNQIQ
jgi:hypothetical protein